MNLEDAINQVDLQDIYTTLHPTMVKKKATFLSSIYGTLSRKDFVKRLKQTLTN